MFVGVVNKVNRELYVHCKTNLCPFLCIFLKAFQSAAYNQGRETHRGSALEIPNPPSTYSRFARMQSASYAALQNSADQNSFNKSPLSPRFKAELQVLKSI